MGTLKKGRTENQDCETENGGKEGETGQRSRRKGKYKGKEICDSDRVIGTRTDVL